MESVYKLTSIFFLNDEKLSIFHNGTSFLYRLFTFQQSPSATKWVIAGTSQSWRDSGSTSWQRSRNRIRKRSKVKSKLGRTAQRYKPCIKSRLINSQFYSLIIRRLINLMYEEKKCGSADFKAVRCLVGI